MAARMNLFSLVSAKVCAQRNVRVRVRVRVRGNVERGQQGDLPTYTITLCTLCYVSRSGDSC